MAIKKELLENDPIQVLSDSLTPNANVQAIPSNNPDINDPLLEAKLKAINDKNQQILNEKKAVVLPGKGLLGRGSTGELVYNEPGKEGLFDDSSPMQGLVNWWRGGGHQPEVKATEDPVPPPSGSKDVRPPVPLNNKVEDKGMDIFGILGDTLNDPAVASLLGRALSGIGKGTDNTTPELMTQNAIIGDVGKQLQEQELQAYKSKEAQLDRENDLKKISSKPQTGTDEPDFWVKQRVKAMQDNLFNTPNWTNTGKLTNELRDAGIDPAQLKKMSLLEKQAAYANIRGYGPEYQMFTRGQGVGAGQPVQQPQSPQGQPVQAAPKAVPAKQVQSFNPGQTIQKGNATYSYVGGDPNSPNSWKKL